MPLNLFTNKKIVFIIKIEHDIYCIQGARTKVQELGTQSINTN